MESAINNIIYKLEGQSWEEICAGVTELNDFLASLVPYVATARNSSTKHPSLARFLALQDGFQHNLASRLLCVYRYTNAAVVHDENYMEIILKTNRLLQGLLLLHPDSRSVFSSASNMSCVLQFVTRKDLPSGLMVSFVSTLIHILLKKSKNMRQFEQLNGCTAVIQHLALSSLTEAPQEHSQQQELNFKIIEFLLFYFIDESPLPPPRLSTAEKIELFRPGFAHIDVLVRNLDDLRAV
ncbi:hypothetical protein JA9_004465 [Meyerozyma sp. JA9]|nr:hypothetical protein JA9_004465 [Meyerozyma sp. JA9]